MTDVVGSFSFIGNLECTGLDTSEENYAESITVSTLNADIFDFGATSGLNFTPYSTIYGVYSFRVQLTQSMWENNQWRVPLPNLKEPKTDSSYFFITSIVLESADLDSHKLQVVQQQAYPGGLLLSIVDADTRAYVYPLGMYVNVGIIEQTYGML